MQGLATRSTNLQITNCSLSGRGQGHVTHSRISHSLIISSERLKLESSKFVCLQAMSSVSLRTADDTADHPWKNRGPGHFSHFRILNPLNFCGMAEDRFVKYCARVSLMTTNSHPSGRGQGHVTS